MRAKPELLAKSIHESYKNVWLLEINGHCNAEDFLAALEVVDLNKLLPVMRRVDENLTYRHQERFKQLSGRVFEFKSHRHRLFCFQTDRGFICTDGMKKQKSTRSRVSDSMIAATHELALRFNKEGAYRD